MTRRAIVAATILCVALASIASAVGDEGGPCQGPEARDLLCPNLRIGPPADLYLQRAGDRLRLRATSDVRSRGRGPIELRGTRNGWRTMRTRQRIYPACNQDPYKDRVTLGTSVGWSDIYPADDKQWIDVTGLRGCFAFVMVVDPSGLLFESNEADNASRRLVHLPYQGDSDC